MYKTLIIILALLMSSGVTAPAVAADKEYTLQKPTYQILREVREQMNNGENQAALSRLKNLLPDIAERKYDTAVVHQTMGYAYHALEDIDNAIEVFRLSVQSEALPPDVTHELHYVLAQLLVYKEHWQEGLEYLKKWFSKESVPDAEAHLLAANVYFQIENYKQAIPHLKDAIKKSDRPQRSWYEMLLAAYVQTRQFKRAAGLLEIMIRRYPDHKDFWLQLAGIYQQLNQDRKAHAVTELAYYRGMLKPEEILNLVKSYLYLEMPYQAGALLTDELQQGTLERNTETIKLLVNSWLSAQEYDRAIEALKQLVILDDDPAHYYQMAQLLVEKEQWQPAINALENVVKSNDFGQPGEAWLLLGMCQYELKDKKASLVSFNKALKHKQSREQAKWWLDTLSEELEEDASSS